MPRRAARAGEAAPEGDGGPAVRVAAPAGRPRVPSGQVVAQHWPVLHHGEVPRGPSPWTVRLFGAVTQPMTLTLEGLTALGLVTVEADVHCVTGWSLLDNRWTGVPFDRIEALARPRPGAAFLMAHAAGGWSTNLALEDCRRPGVAVAFARNGDPLPPAHGGPVRLLVPHLYFWKSCKWLIGLEWMEEDRPGFWERDTIYHNLDPWHAEPHGGEDPAAGATPLGTGAAGTLRTP
jgi:DMSO/TMAO reductase YedYZ molybdopterin-dependent catalytic subunit